MPIIDVYKSQNSATIEQLPLQRDWMDITFDRHAYQCFPISISNRLGWGISFPEDISFIWDGINDSNPEANHVKILSGDQYANSLRANRTVSFHTGLTFFSKENQKLSIMTMPVPNQFIRGAQCMTTIISPSVLQGDLPIAWIISEPNITITIPAGTPVAAILPISTASIQENELMIKSGKPEYMTEQWGESMKGRSAAAQSLNSVGKWTNFYRDAVDHTGATSGEHESKKIIMKVTHE